MPELWVISQGPSKSHPFYCTSPSQYQHHCCCCCSCCHSLTTLIAFAAAACACCCCLACACPCCCCFCCCLACASTCCLGTSCFAAAPFAAKALLSSQLSLLAWKHGVHSAGTPDGCNKCRRCWGWVWREGFLATHCPHCSKALISATAPQPPLYKWKINIY